MKKVFAILALAASLAACARMEQPVDGTPETTPEGTETPARTYTLTVRATKDAGTRVLELVTDGETHRQTLNAKWTEGDKVEVYDGETCLGELTAGAVAEDGMSCTFSGELERLPGESPLTLKYLSPAYEEQDGTLEYISENCDYAEAEINVTMDGTTITCGDAVFVSRQAVVKFLLKDKAGAAISPTNFAVMSSDFNVMDSEKTVATVTPIADTYTTNGAGVLYVAVPAVNNEGIVLSATAGNATYTYWKSGVTLEAGQYYSIAVKMFKFTRIIDLSDDESYNSFGIFTAKDGDILTGTFPGGDRQVRIDDGATVMLLNASIVSSTHEGIALNGNATILLMGENIVRGGDDNEDIPGNPGISVPSGSTLTIDGISIPSVPILNFGGVGRLTAKGGFGAAGIGGGSDGSCGNIIILGGQVKATGGDYGAGIGSGADGSCGAITISGGTVTAEGGEWAAGIGSGDNASCGAITISYPAQVIATMGDDAEFSIGPASQYLPCGTVTIYGEVWGYWDEDEGAFECTNDSLYENPLYINWPSE